jgi:hypothetical protein
MAGVGGEPAGRVERPLHRRGRHAQAREHVVERAGERADLDRTLVVGQRRAEVLGPAHPRGSGPQARERADGERREAPRRERRQRERREPDHEHEPAQVVGARLHRREAGRELQPRVGPVRAERHRQRAPLVPADLERGEAVARRDRRHVVGHVAALVIQSPVVGDLGERPAADEQPLAAPRAAPAAPGAAAEPAVEAVVVALRRGRDARDARAQVGVDGGASVALDRRDQRRAGGEARERDGEHRRERDPRAQALRRPHGRSTQPMPRTVCSIRGSPPASSLRRTYPTNTSTTFVSTSEA